MGSDKDKLYSLKNVREKEAREIVEPFMAGLSRYKPEKKYTIKESNTYVKGIPMTNIQINESNGFFSTKNLGKPVLTFSINPLGKKEIKFSGGVKTAKELHKKLKSEGISPEELSNIYYKHLKKKFK